MNNSKSPKAFSLVLNLGWRRLVLSVYRFVAPLASKTGLTRIFLGKNTIGSGINSFFNKIINLHLPEPIEAQGMIMYQGTSNERGSFGMGYVFDYELETRRAFRRVVKPGMTVVDVGPISDITPCWGQRWWAKAAGYTPLSRIPCIFLCLRKISKQTGSIKSWSLLTQ